MVSGAAAMRTRNFECMSWDAANLVRESSAASRIERSEAEAKGAEAVCSREPQMVHWLHDVGLTLLLLFRFVSVRTKICSETR